MIISFCGPAGSGKSTMAKMLADKLEWPRYYIGGIRRQKAAERGMTLAEYNKLGEESPETDIEVDEYQKKLGETEDNFIIEGRTSWHFIPHSLKIYIDVDEKIGAQRVFETLQKENERNEDNELKTVDDVLASHKKRKTSDIIRYKKYYDFDVYDKSNYDFIIDSSNQSKEESFEQLYGFVKGEL
ncbi:MAG: AAA family ATPase [Patescibacteria group bacterium]|jgi:cytidylate kinase|nr:AAA family ATPase [Patescibacteria group bacterium]